ncbi:helix-turn-helix domain-containing protein [Rodentibacter trehalosifermentans]|uniref:Transcriptional regulator n=1 Tax=Rodentibacter trehalosifermentans TaxID=1908263 RepID=A0A1V3IYA5_9PAST|nr:helix-turn-helix transcriptional regulator [Rodentibacter trehalosifermentans]OOF47321.1 transcriptional regulator [Rodentibacter trehalosifermentans]OOF49038.1 transcriptional regulator [Rodentibacter trehalosifermentans]OOF49306.1 transcriptional regulator [Rodentibacter trehalosifermentans]
MKLNLNYNEVNKRIGKTIAKYRQQSGFTQEQVAEILEIGNEAVSRMERGIIIPNAVRLIELAEIFGCTAADLIGESSPRASDQLHHIHRVMIDLTESDRNLMMNFLHCFSERLKQSG